MSRIIIQLPDAGLGNQLFPLMKGLLFAELNNLSAKVLFPPKIKIGPYLRADRSKRNYNRFFNFQKNRFLSAFQFFNHKYFYRNEIEKEPKIEKLNLAKGVDYFFSEMNSYQDYFKELKNHRSLVKEILWNNLEEEIKNEIQNAEIPEIGVHVRLGDFRKLAESEQFRGGHVRTPENYFVDVINGIRELSGKNLKATIFSDGYPNQLPLINSMENIEFSKGLSDISDLIVLSKSKVIVSSAGSSFSAWSGFLSDGVVLKHPMHINEPYRLESNLFEGLFDVENNFLRKLIKEI